VKKTDVLEEHDAIFRAEELTKQETSMKQAAIRSYKNGNRE
jgi:hypothetical protein